MMKTNNYLCNLFPSVRRWGQMTLILVCLFVVTGAAAGPVSRQQALQKAQQFMQKRGDRAKLVAVTSSKRLAPRRASAAQAEPYYVFDRGQKEGFVIVSGDDQTIDVLGYTDCGEFDYEQLAPGLQDLLNVYADQIEAIRQGAPVAKLPANHPKVDAMMKSKWSQGSPYNDACPLDNGRRSVTGCVATAMAQILYYNRERMVTETTAAIPGYSTWTKGIAVSGIAKGAPIDWDNMKDTYNSATDLQKKAVANLMLYCGVGVKMDYTNSSSGAQSSDACEAFRNYFGCSKVEFKTPNNVGSDDEWDRVVYQEMAAGRPVYVSGSNATVGHAFVAHGYENQRYYINWGWGGQSDGLYYLTNLTPGDGQGIGGSDDGYNSWKQIVVGIEPDNYAEKVMTISDATARKLCLEHWDADGNGKLTYGEIAAVTDLGTAFKGNSTVKDFSELYYFTGLTSLADDAFNGCSELGTIKLPKSLKKVGARAFKDCAALRQIILPSGVNAIGSEAFSGCKLLSAFELPDGITTVEDGTFKGCQAISSFELPISVGKLGAEAFAGCTRLTSFTVKTFHPENVAMGTAVFGNIDLSKASLTIMQGTKSWFTNAEQWKDFGKIIEQRDISEGKFAEIEVGQTYYLYNVGTGKYLTKGEAWGTQAIVGTSPMRFKVNRLNSMPEGVYYLTSPDTGNDVSYLFRSSTDSNVGQGVKAAFVDGTSLTANARWSIKAVADKIYTIQIPENAADYVEGEFWGVQPDHQSSAASPTNGVFYDVVYDTHQQGCQWQFVLYDATVTQRYNAAEKLGSLLATAKKRNVKCAEEQVVYDNLESTLEDILAAQSSMRKKLGFIEFYHQEAADKFILYFDADTDGELSYKEAAEVTDFGWLFGFAGTTSIVHLDELQYFTHATAIQGSFAQNCTNLETTVLPEGLQYIYYHAFYGCRKLKAINIPEFVGTIGENAFYNCTSLREITVMNPDPYNIELGNNVFYGVPVAECTLYVPYGSKDLYAEAPVWKNFGKIVEVRGRTQPKLSPFTTDKTGYIYNVGTRKMITMGEAYGTQSIVSRTGRLYKIKRTGDNYYLYDNETGKVVFRTNTDSKVGSGVKACFGDGGLSTKAYWTLEPVDETYFKLHVPASDADYVEGEYLGVEENHKSDFASPTNGVYWDIDGSSRKAQWAFIAEEDLKSAQEADKLVENLKAMLELAKRKNLDVSEEQTVYDNYLSTNDQLRSALLSVRNKLHFITFSDEKSQSICLANWDADDDGELSFEEAAAVTDIGEIFRGATTMTSFEEFRYFTSLTEIPANAFRNDFALQAICLPKSVKKIGNGAFTSCSKLIYLVVLNDSEVVPFGSCSLNTETTVFVPANLVASYEADESWAEKTITEYTGKPIVTAEATRIYGRTFGTVSTKVLGAPICGEPEVVCEGMTDAKLPVGSYPIQVNLGTITTLGVELREGVLTITPATLTITAKSYTRSVGEANPEFEVTYKGFRNKEDESVLTAKPVITCEATADSPAGEYEIKVSGAEAGNYEMKYVFGVLTVKEASAIGDVRADEQRQGRIYDLQGRQVNGTDRRGVQVVGGKKVLKR